MKKNWMAWIPLALFVGAIGFLNWTFSICSDDCFYATYWDGSSWRTVGTIWNAFLLEVRDPHRPFVHFLARIFCGCFDKSVFNVCNALMAGFLLVMINRVARKTWRLEWPTLLVTMAMSFFVLFKGESYLWICGSTNYLWGCVFTLVFLLIRERLEDDTLSTSATLALIPAAALIGEANEAFSPPICIALAIFGLKDFKRLNWKKIAIYSAYGLAAMALCIHETGRASQIPERTVANTIIALAKVVLTGKCVWIAALCFAFVRDKRSFISTNLFEIIVIVISMIVSVCIGFVAERVSLVTNLLAIVVVVRSVPVKKWVGTLSGLSTLIVMCALVPLGLQIRASFDRFVEDYKRTKDGVVCHDYVPCGCFGRFFHQVVYQWQRAGYHPNIFSRFYGRPGFLPIGLTKELYEGVYKTDSFCSSENRLKIDLEAYSSPDGNTIVVPIVSGGPLDTDFNEVEVVYDRPTGIIGKLRHAWENQGRPLIPFPWFPERIHTEHGDYWLVGKDLKSNAYIKTIRFKHTARPHPDAGKWWIKHIPCLQSGDRNAD